MGGGFESGREFLLLPFFFALMRVGLPSIWRYVREPTNACDWIGTRTAAQERVALTGPSQQSKGLIDTLTSPSHSLSHNLGDWAGCLLEGGHLEGGATTQRGPKTS